MARIALLLDGDWETAPRVERVLVEAGFDVEVNPEWDRLDGFDLCWLRANYWEPHLRDLMAKALVLEARGAAFLNSIAAALRCADKLVTGEILAGAGVLVPCAWGSCRPGEEATGDIDWVVKPRVGAGQQSIEVLTGHDEVREYLTSCSTEQVAQKWITGRNWRVIASPEGAIRTYTMPVDARGVTLLAEGASRDVIEHPDPSLEEVATEVVRVLGGTLLGIDLIEDQAGQYWVLEANAGFGFNPGDDAVEEAIVEAFSVTAAARVSERSSTTPVAPSP